MIVANFLLFNACYRLPCLILPKFFGPGSEYLYPNVFYYSDQDAAPLELTLKPNEAFKLINQAKITHFSSFQWVQTIRANKAMNSCVLFGKLDLYLLLRAKYKT